MPTTATLLTAGRRVRIDDLLIATGMPVTITKGQATRLRQLNDLKFDIKTTKSPEGEKTEEA